MIKEVKNWIVDKWRRLKKWLAVIIVGGTVIALAAPLLIPNGGVEGVDVFIDENPEVLDENTTITKKALNLIEASGEAGLKGYYEPVASGMENSLTWGCLRNRDWQDACSQKPTLLGYRQSD